MKNGNGMDPNVRNMIGALAPFRTVSPPALEAVLADARLMRFRQGESLFAQGDAATSFFLLVQGRVKIQQLTPHGRQIVLIVAGPGEFFGLASGIGLSTYPAAAVAVMPGLAAVWPSPAWERLAASHPDVARNAMRNVGQRLLEMQTRLREISAERVEKRIARAILRLVQQSGVKMDDGVMIDFPISRQDIAEMTGTTLHTVSRTLAAWEQSGTLIGGRRRIHVRDAQALHRLAHD